MINFLWYNFYCPLSLLQATAEKPEKPEVATVVSKYKAEGPSEISLNAGQLVHVILKNPDGWWQGELQVSLSTFVVLEWKSIFNPLTARMNSSQKPLRPKAKPQVL